MKLYITQKIFSWNDKFSVKNAMEEERYYVEGEFFSWGKKLHMYDHMHQEVAFVQQEVLTLLPKFHVLVNGQEVAEIVKEFTFFKPKYRIEGLGWDVDGDFWDHDYDITQNGRTIVSIHKQWMTWGDCYEIDIEDTADEIVALAVVLAIDCVLAAQRN